MKERQELLRFYFENNTDDVIIIFDSELRILDVSPSVKAIFGYDPSELIGQRQQDIRLLSEESVPDALSDMQQLLTGQPFLSRVSKFVRKDGSVRFGESSQRPFRKRQGAQEYIAIIRDITSRVQAEEGLKQRVQFERTLAAISREFLEIDHIDDAINSALQHMGELSGAHRTYLFLLREDGITLDNTHEWCAEGVSPQINSLQGIHSDKFGPGDSKMRSGQVMHIPDVSKMPDEASAEKEFYQMQDIKSLLLVPIQIAGQYGGFVGFDNISEAKPWTSDDLYLLQATSDLIGTSLERKRIWESYQAREEQYRLLVNTMNEGLTMVNADGVITFVNSRMCEMNGYTPEELIGHSFKEFLDEPDAEIVNSQIAAGLDKGKEICRDYEFDTKRKDGTKIRTLASPRNWLDEKGNFRGRISVITDISEQKEAQARLKTYAEEVERVNQNLERLVSERTAKLEEEVAERERTEEALRKSEERHRFLFETMAQGVIYQDADGKVISANPAAETILGLTLDQLQRRTVFDPRAKFIHEDGSPFPAETLPAIMTLRTGKPIKGVVMGIFTPPDKRLHWLSGEAVPQFKPGENRPFQVYCTFTDITESKRMEQEIQRKNEELGSQNKTLLATQKELQTNIGELVATKAYIEGLLKSMSDGVCVINPQGTIIDANESVLRMMGLPRDEYVGRPLRELISIILPPEQREDSATRVDQLTTGVGLPNVEVTTITRDGRQIELSASESIARDEDGNPVSILFVLRDITEHKAMEKHLEESERLYRAIFDSSPTALYIVQESKFLFVNQRLCELLGYAEDELIGTESARLIHPEDQATARNEVIHRLKYNILSPYEYRVITRNGETRVIMGTVASIQYRGKRAVLGSYVDITERKQAEEELRRLSARLVQIQEEERLSIFHELHDEVGQLMTYLSILLHQAHKSAKGQKATDFEEGRNILAELNERVRNLTRQIRPPMLEMGLAVSITQMVERFREQSDIGVQTDIPELPHMGDQLATAIYRIVQESLNNIMKHSCATQAIVHVWEENGMICLEIKDNGIGFESKSAYFTSGLIGMKERAHSFGGELNIESIPGKGTHISAKLPLEKSSP